MADLAAGDTFGELAVERQIGSGAFGTVYLARDELIGRKVALKVVPGDEGQREQILLEARLVGKLVHGNIVTLHRVHPPRDAGGWGFEFEFVDGGTLKDLGRVPPARAVELARGIAAGLEAAHRAGVVHGDIKPGNVLLTSDGTPKIADFGLGRLLGDLSLRSADLEGAAGTPSYMAPEILMGDPATPASDVWSFGVCLYWMACGRLPFPSQKLHGLVYAIQNLEPPAPPEGTPPELAGAIRACLAKLPGDRPQNARGVAEILRAERPAPAPVAVQVRPLPVTTLRGRDKEIAFLRERVEAARTEGTGCCVLLSGDEGIGKTALASEAGRWARGLGFVWVQAKVSALEGVVRPLLRGVLAVGAPSDQMHDASASQRIGRVLESSDSLRIDRSQPALATLERSLGEILRERRLGLVIEDLHEGNTDDLQFSSDLARRMAADGAVVILCARPTGPDGVTHKLGSRRFVAPLALGPLSREESYALLEDVAAASLAPEVVRRIHATAAGNPRFLSELLRHLLESGCVVEREGRVEPGPEWEAFQLPRRLRDIVVERLEQVSAEDRELLDVAAVAGGEFDSSDVAAVAGRPVLGVLRSLQGIYRDRELVIPLERGYRFATPMVEEVIYDELAPDLRRVLHRAFAERLEANPDVDPEHLVVHWDRAGEAERAAPWCLRAAQAASKRLENHRAIDLAAKGGVSAATIDEETAYEHRVLLLGLSGLHFDLGEFEAAERIAEMLLAALKDKSDERLRLQTLARRAQWRYRTGGADAVDLEVLEQAGRELPACTEKFSAHNLLAIILKFRGDLDAAEAHVQQALATLQVSPNDGLKASALDLQASIALRRGRLADAERLFGESARLSTACGLRRNAATSDVNRVLASFRRGALEGLEADLRRAIRTLELEEALYLAAHSRVILANVQYAEGKLDAAREGLERAVALLRERSYWLGLADGLVHLGAMHTVAGRYDEALETLREAAAMGLRHGSLSARSQALAWQVKCRVARGEMDDALETAAQCRELLRETEDTAIRREAVRQLSEAAFMGLPKEALPDDALAPDEDSAALLRAAHAWHAPQGTDELKTASEALRDPKLAERRAEMRILADVLEAEALRRDGDDTAAARLAARARGHAQDLGHAWYGRES
ncbi:MAG: protein kinase domain-containing protein [Planctomycetota bacterium]